MIDPQQIMYGQSVYVDDVFGFIEASHISLTQSLDQVPTQIL